MKRLALFITMILVSLSIHAQEYTKVNPTLVASYETGYGDEFLVGTGDGRSPGIRSIEFVDRNLLALTGELKSIIQIDEKYALTKFLEIENSGISNFAYSRKLYTAPENGLAGLNHEASSYWNLDKNKGYCIPNLGLPIVYEISFPFEHISFFWEKSGEIFSVKNPTSDKNSNLSRLLSPEQTRQLFAAKDPVIPEGLSIDDKDRLFYKGELYTRDWVQVNKYWKEVYSDWVKGVKHRFIPWAETADVIYMGSDANGFTYWQVYKDKFMILDCFGVVADILKKPEQSHILPAIHPSGDIYTMSFDEKHAYLWRIERQWGLDGRPVRTGTATGNNLRVREDSVLDARILTTLKENEACTVTAIGKLETIGGNRAPWYKVKTKDGIVGWAWGGFLKVAQ